MVWTITILTFVASLAVVGAIFYALTPDRSRRGRASLSIV